VTLKPEQSRAARGLLDWSVVQLAMRANLPEDAVRNFESGQAVLAPKELAAVRAALELAGVEFLDGNRPGVRRKWRGGIDSEQAARRRDRDWLRTLVLSAVALGLLAMLLFDLAQRYL
jgi:hypothetical protein